MTPHSNEYLDRPAVTCQGQAALVRSVHSCETVLAELDNDERLLAARDEDRQQARQMLEAMAAHCRRASGVFELDPTLADEERVREIDRLVELVRQLCVMVPSVLRAPAGEGRFGRDGAAICQQWREAHLLSERVPVLADDVLARARLDHDTVAGQHAISLRRVGSDVGGFPESLRGMRQKLRPALAVEHPHPHATALAELIDQLDERVAAVQAATSGQQTE